MFGSHSNMWATVLIGSAHRPCISLSTSYPITKLKIGKWASLGTAERCLSLQPPVCGFVVSIKKKIKASQRKELNDTDYKKNSYSMLNWKLARVVERVRLKGRLTGPLSFVKFTHRCGWRSKAETEANKKQWSYL